MDIDTDNSEIPQTKCGLSKKVMQIRDASFSLFLII